MSKVSEGIRPVLPVGVLRHNAVRHQLARDVHVSTGRLQTGRPEIRNHTYTNKHSLLHFGSRSQISTEQCTGFAFRFEHRK